MGVLIALLTADWRRATSRVPADRFNLIGVCSTAAKPGFVLEHAPLVWTLRMNTNEGFRRSSDAECADEPATRGACSFGATSEKSIFPKAYGPAFIGTEVAVASIC